MIVRLAREKINLKANRPCISILGYIPHLIWNCWSTCFQKFWTGFHFCSQHLYRVEINWNMINLLWNFIEKGGRQALRKGDGRPLKYDVLKNPLMPPMELLYIVARILGKEKPMVARIPPRRVNEMRAYFRDCTHGFGCFLHFLPKPNLSKQIRISLFSWSCKRNNGFPLFFFCCPWSLLELLCLVK